MIQMVLFLVILILCDCNYNYLFYMLLYLDYLEANDSMLMGIMMRFRTLSATNQSLVQMLMDTSDQVHKVLCLTSFHWF